MKSMWDKSGTNSIFVFLLKLTKVLIVMVIAGGLEPPTYCLEGIGRFIFDSSVTLYNYAVIPIKFLQKLILYCLVVYREVPIISRCMWDKSGTNEPFAVWVISKRSFQNITSGNRCLHQTYRILKTKLKSKMDVCGGHYEGRKGS